MFTFRWMEACLKDELPPTTELEEALRTGVILARLGNFFASDVVPVRKIYDRELKRFQVRKCIRDILNLASLTQSCAVCYSDQ